MLFNISFRNTIGGHELMKKLVLIIAMILCLATVGSVFALAVFNAKEVTGTITADGYEFFEMDSTIDEAPIILQKDNPIVKTINLHLRASMSTEGRLNITLGTLKDKSLDNITLALYEDKECTKVLSTITGGSTLTYNVQKTNDTKVTIYLSISISSDITESDFESAGGTLTLNFSKVE